MRLHQASFALAAGLAALTAAPANAQYASRLGAFRSLADDGAAVVDPASSFSMSVATEEFVAVGAKSSKAGGGPKSGKSVTTTTTSTSTSITTAAATTTTAACEVTCADKESLETQITGLQEQIDALKSQVSSNAVGINANSNWIYDPDGQEIGDGCGLFVKCQGTFACRKGGPVEFFSENVSCGSCNAQSACDAQQLGTVGGLIGSRSCNAVVGCFALPPTSSVGNDSCNDGLRACSNLGLNTTIGNNSCLGKESCKEVGGRFVGDGNPANGPGNVVIGNNACQGEGACCGILTGEVADGECIGDFSCCNPDYNNNECGCPTP
ncbi:hypothetical protein ACHAXT_010597 [Thalassiosira profunda]